MPFGYFFLKKLKEDFVKTPESSTIELSGLISGIALEIKGDNRTKDPANPFIIFFTLLSLNKFI